MAEVTPCPSPRAFCYHLDSGRLLSWLGRHCCSSWPAGPGSEPLTDQAFPTFSEPGPPPSQAPCPFCFLLPLTSCDRDCHTDPNQGRFHHAEIPHGAPQGGVGELAGHGDIWGSAPFMCLSPCWRLLFSASWEGGSWDRCRHRGPWIAWISQVLGHSGGLLWLSGHLVSILRRHRVGIRAGFLRN